MTERDKLAKKWKEAISRGQFDIADEYFQATLEAGAKEMDALSPGSGDVWRSIGQSMIALSAAFADKRSAPPD